MLYFLVHTKPRADTSSTSVLHPAWRLSTFKYVVYQRKTPRQILYAGLNQQDQNWVNRIGDFEIVFIREMYTFFQWGYIF